MSSPLVKGTKLSDSAVRRIVHGFAFGEPAAGIAAEADASTKAVVSLLRDLRPRLSAPPFYRWKSPGVLFTLHRVPYQETVEQAVFGVLMLCYENKRCRSNYIQGRRVTRMCRGCPTSTIFEDYPTQQRAIAFADTIAEFYSRLGVGGERAKTDLERTRVFMLRWTHTLVVLRAMAASGRIAPDVPPSGEGAFQDCEALHATLIAELERIPLARST